MVVKVNLAISIGDVDCVRIFHDNSGKYSEIIITFLCITVVGSRHWTLFAVADTDHEKTVISQGQIV